MICEGSPLLAPSAPEVVALDAGDFLMGSSRRDKFANDTERPAHRVHFKRPFAVARFPVTVAEFREFRHDHATGEIESLPVVNVSWDDANAFCAWLTSGTGRSYRLPTEAEWEFACRAGTDGPFSTGDDITTDAANYLYSETGQRIGPGNRTSVGSYPANEFGLHDLHGNVCEWLEDVWHPNYRGAPDDGSAWVAGGDPARRVIRGGAWDYLPRLLRSSWRDSLLQLQRQDNVGFRVAADLL
jgi:formylglycine-generating enzyme required for sulfatase activity